MYAEFPFPGIAEAIARGEFQLMAMISRVARLVILYSLRNSVPMAAVPQPSHPGNRSFKRKAETGPLGLAVAVNDLYPMEHHKVGVRICKGRKLSG